MNTSFDRKWPLVALLAAAGMGLSTASVAGMVKDTHGNVGYDTAAECDAAVKAGTAVFYKSFTHKPPLKRKGEASVRSMPLKDLGIPANVVSKRGFDVNNYAGGACDIGAGHSAGRDGVAKQLQGKYVPYSPDMLVNVYYDKNGNAVRAMMKQCDNWFGDRFPRPTARMAAAAQRPVAPAVAAAPAAPAAPAVVAPMAPAAPVAVAPAAPATSALGGAKAAIASAVGKLTTPTVLGIAGGVALGAVLLSNNNDDSGSTSGTGTTTTTTTTTGK